MTPEAKARQQIDQKLESAGWVVQDMKQLNLGAGLGASKDKGIWTITEEGRKAYLELPEPEAFYRRACKLYVEWKAAQPDADLAAQLERAWELMSRTRLPKR